MMFRFLSPLYVTLFAASVVLAEVAIMNGTEMDVGVLNATAPPTMPDGLLNATAPPTMPDSMNLTEAVSLEETIMSNPNLTTLAAAVNASGIFATLEGIEGYFTLFAPDNDAFAKVDPATLEKLLQPSFILHLQNLLAYHVTFPTPELVFSSDLTDGMVLSMLNEEDVTLGIDGGVVSVVDGNNGTAVVTTRDVKATDGVLHVIDTVLTPVFLGQDLIALASEVEELSILADLMVASKADQLIPSTGDYTILAPTDEAFLKLGDETIEMLFNDTDLFLGIITNHVLQGVYPSVLLSDGQVIKSVSGYSLTVSLDEGVMINDANVVEPDILASNGIVHVIDAVLLAEVPDAMPSASPGGDEESMEPTASMVPSHSGMPSPTEEGPPLGPISVPPQPAPTPMPLAPRPTPQPAAPSTSGATSSCGIFEATAMVMLVALMVV